MNYSEAPAIDQIVRSARHIVVVQADNPDGDSLGSALALETILAAMGKEVSLYCGVDMPTYLHHMPGWDRVAKELPHMFDVSIIVDASTLTLLEKLEANGQLSQLATKPCVVLDHHSVVERTIDFAKILLCDTSIASTGELIYHLSRQLTWPVDRLSGEYLAHSILGDTQGLTNDLAKPSTYRVMAELVELGVNRPQLEEQRRAASKMSPTIYRYKGQLIGRTELHYDDIIATVTVPQAEINEFSPLYNPAALVQFDILQIEGVKLSIVFKCYDDGKITGAIRSNYGVPVAARLAELMGGGGHPYASGFKITDGRPFNEVKSECLRQAATLLATLQTGPEHETIQHSF
jgi:phosphoesterase RecJ-like protein